MDIFIGILVVFSIMMFIIMPEIHHDIFNEKTNERIINLFLKIFTPFENAGERDHYRRAIRQRLDEIYRATDYYRRPATAESLSALLASKQVLQSIDTKEVKNQCKKTHYVLTRELPGYIKSLNNDIEVVQKCIRAYDDPLDFINPTINLRKQP